MTFLLSSAQLQALISPFPELRRWVSVDSSENTGPSWAGGGDDRQTDRQRCWSFWTAAVLLSQDEVAVKWRNTSWGGETELTGEGEDGFLTRVCCIRTQSSWKTAEENKNTSPHNKTEQEIAKLAELRFKKAMNSGNNYDFRPKIWRAMCKSMFSLITAPPSGKMGK